MLLILSCWIIAGITAEATLTRHYRVKNSSFCLQAGKSAGSSDIMWTFNKTMIIVLNKVVEPNFTNKVDYNPSNISLCINELSETDSGIYEVQLSNNGRSSSETHILTVQETVPTPVIRMSVMPPNISADLCNITVNCTVQHDWMLFVCDQDSCRESQGSLGKVNITTSVVNRSIVCISNNDVSRSIVSKSIEAMCFSRQPDPEVKTSHVVLLVVIVAIIAVGFAVIIIIVCVAERDGSTKCNQFQAQTSLASLVQIQQVEIQPPSVARASTSSDVSYENAKMEEYQSKQVPENLDDPPNSRLFAVTSRSITEDELRESFSVFGDIQGVWVVKDKQTKESKGISYVKFAKSSQACLAMEEMHGKVLMEGTKPIKVFIAQSRSSNRHRDVEDEELTRIFVMIPKTFTEEDLKDTFKEYGDIEYCVIIKNKFTGESKGLGYVRYYKPSQAALAIENCDKTYRAILAEPRTKAAATDEYSGGGGGGRGDYVPSVDSMNQYALPMADPGNYPVMDYRSGDFTRCLMMSTRAALTQEQIFALFDLIPGMEYCELQRDAYGMSKGHALIRYSNLGSAVYAKEKLNGFEYPPGNRLAVNFVDDGEDRSSPVGRMAMQFVATQMMSAVWNGPSTSQVMKPPGFQAVSPMSRVQTDVNLPPLKKLAPPDSKSKERLFVVFSPSPLPPDVLEDVFCRFGSLIEVHLVPGRKVGYMKYADKQCADEAMAALHGRVVNGVKMKVMLADPPREESHKRPRNF